MSSVRWAEVEFQAVVVQTVRVECPDPNETDASIMRRAVASLRGKPPEVVPLLLPYKVAAVSVMARAHGEADSEAVEIDGDEVFSACESCDVELFEGLDMDSARGMEEGGYLCGKCAAETGGGS